MDTALLVTVAGLGAVGAWLVLAGLVRPALRAGLVDVPGGRKVHAGAVPLLGGTALLAAWALGLGLAAWSSGMPDRAGLFALGLGALYAVGLWDDWGGKAMPAGIKAATTGVVLLSWSIALGTGAGTALVAFAILHSLNTSDNMNGLAGGLSLCSLGVLGLASAVPPLPGGGAPALALAAGLVVFLRRNFPGGRVFLGDSGSLLLGGWFAFLWMRDPDPAVLCFVAVPLGDLLGMGLRRLLRRRAPWQGDRDHLSHRLASWWGPRGAVAALVAAQALASLLGATHRAEPSAPTVALTLLGLIAALTLTLPPRNPAPASS